MSRKINSPFGWKELFKSCRHVSLPIVMAKYPSSYILETNDGYVPSHVDFVLGVEPKDETNPIDIFVGLNEHAVDTISLLQIAESKSRIVKLPVPMNVLSLRWYCSRVTFTNVSAFLCGHAPFSLRRELSVFSSWEEIPLYKSLCKFYIARYNKSHGINHLAFAPTKALDSSRRIAVKMFRRPKIDCPVLDQCIAIVHKPSTLIDFCHAVSILFANIMAIQFVREQNGLACFLATFVRFRVHGCPIIGIKQLGHLVACQFRA